MFSPLDMYVKLTKGFCSDEEEDEYGCPVFIEEPYAIQMCRENQTQECLDDCPACQLHQTTKTLRLTFDNGTECESANQVIYEKSSFINQIF